MKSFAVNGNVQWFPTELTTVTAKANRTVQDSIIPTSPGNLDTGGSIQVDHELRYNVILSGMASFDDYAYQGIDRDDQRWSIGIGAKYLLTQASRIRP